MPEKRAELPGGDSRLEDEEDGWKRAAYMEMPGGGGGTRSRQGAGGG
jgi:hypothetical protein